MPEMRPRRDRPRVLVITLGRFGGVTQYGWLMARGLAQRCPIAVVSSAGAENREKWSSLGVPHLEVETFSSLRGMLLSLLSVTRFVRIRRFARAFRPDIVYYTGAHSWKPILDLVLPRTARIVLTIHDPHLHAGEDSMLHRLHDALNRRRVDGYVLLNEAQRSGYIARHGLRPDAVAVIPHGILDDFGPGKAALAEIDDLVPVAAHAGRYLLFVGRIRAYKGIDTLLEAYRALSVTRPEVPLVIAGSGEFSEAEERLLSELRDRPVHVVNRWLSDADISALVSAARFVVLPYTSATQSGVIPLASAFGVPAIASDAGGLTEQVVDGQTGLLYRAGDEQALSAAMERASLMGDEEHAAMGAAAKEHAQRHWSWETLSGELVAFFERLRP